MNEIIPFIPLISAISGALIAYLGAYVNQGFSINKERKKLLREKIEEAYLLTEILEVWGHKAYDFLTHQNDYDKFIESTISISETTTKLKMTIYFYHPELKKECDAIENKTVKLGAYLTPFRLIPKDERIVLIDEVNIRIKDVTESTKCLRRKLEAKINKYI